MKSHHFPCQTHLKMAQKDPEDGKIPADSRPTSSSVAKGPDEDWVHVVSSEPVCRDLSASSCYVALSEADVNDRDGTLSNDEEAEHSMKTDAVVSQKESDVRHTANVDDGDDAVCNSEEEAEYSVMIDAKETSPKRSDHGADVDDGDDAACEGVEAEQPVEMGAEKVLLENNDASKTTDHIVPPTRFNLILMQSKSPILHLLSAKLVDRVEGQKPPDDHNSDVD